MSAATFKSYVILEGSFTPGWIDFDVTDAYKSNSLPNGIMLQSMFVAANGTNIVNIDIKEKVSAPQLLLTELPLKFSLPQVM